MDIVQKGKEFGILVNNNIKTGKSWLPKYIIKTSTMLVRVPSKAIAMGSGYTSSLL
jgi:hypothetical protein